MTLDNVTLPLCDWIDDEIAEAAAGAGDERVTVAAAQVDRFDRAAGAAAGNHPQQSATTTAHAYVIMMSAKLNHDKNTAFDALLRCTSSYRTEQKLVIGDC